MRRSEPWQHDPPCTPSGSYALLRVLSVTTADGGTCSTRFGPRSQAHVRSSKDIRRVGLASGACGGTAATSARPSAKSPMS
jgi:hypothetical protein